MQNNENQVPIGDSRIDWQMLSDRTENDQGMWPKFGGLAREIASESGPLQKPEAESVILSLSFSLSERVDRGTEV